MKAPGPQSETWRAGKYRLPARRESVGWIGFLVLVILAVAALGAGVAIALSAMRPGR